MLRQVSHSKRFRFIHNGKLENFIRSGFIWFGRWHWHVTRALSYSGYYYFNIWLNVECFSRSTKGCQSQSAFKLVHNHTESSFAFQVNSAQELRAQTMKCVFAFELQFCRFFVVISSSSSIIFLPFTHSRWDGESVPVSYGMCWNRRNAKIIAKINLPDFLLFVSRLSAAVD